MNEAVSALKPPLDVLAAYPRHDFTLGSLLASRLAREPGRDFLLFEGRRWSWRDFDAAVARASGWLLGRGVRPGERVGVIAPNHPAGVILLFALARLGAIMVPTNPDFGVDEAKYVFTHAGVSGVLCAPAAVAVAEAACADLATRPWFVLTEPGVPGFEAFEEAVAGAAPPPYAALPDVGPDSTCLIIYTSGTTGFPKGVMHSQRSAILAGEGFVGRLWLQPDERLLCVLPLFHINALFYSLLGAVAAGATLILERRFSASTFWRIAAESGATETNLIGAAGAILLKRDPAEFVPGHRLRKIATAPLTAEVVAGFRDRFGVPDLIETYGMSEIPGLLGNPFPGPRKLGSMGCISPHPDPTLPRPELRVVDDDGAELPAGEVGELVVRTPTIMQGYYRAPDLTAAAFRDGWFLTGDLCHRDADGFYFFFERKKDIIRRRGENISGAELDRVIGSHPAVLEAAALGVPSPMGEEDILVAVVRRPGAALDEAGVADWVRRHLAAVKVPRYVAFVDSLPRTPTQRVAKFRLREDKALRARAVDLEASRPTCRPG